MKIFYSIVKLVRFIVNIPLLIFINLGTIYAKFLLLIDRRNHSAFWQKNLQTHIDKFLSKKIIISTKPYKYLRFYIPSQVAGYRVKTFFSKEPETLEWLNNNGNKIDTFLDIGANMGVYSVYFAKKFGGKVFAFEPSYKNLEYLTKNIKINSLQEHITIISNPLSASFEINNYYQEDFIGGEAGAGILNQKNVERELKNSSKMNSIIYNTLCLPLNNFYNFNSFQKSFIIKIDVDGNELDILRGAEKILEQNLKISLLIEVSEKTEKEVNKILKKHNFKMINKFNKNKIVYNTIWEQ